MARVSRSDTSGIFISYARTDAEFALKLGRELRASGVPVWIDQLDIAAGERWDDAIHEALIACPRMLLVLSPAAVGSSNVKDEVRYALDQGKDVIPVLHKDCELPFWLHRLQRIDVRGGIGELLRALAVRGNAAPRA